MLEQNEGHYAPKILESGCSQPKNNIKNVIVLSLFLFTFKKRREKKRKESKKYYIFYTHLLKFLGEYSYKKTGFVSSFFFSLFSRGMRKRQRKGRRIKKYLKYR